MSKNDGEVELPPLPDRFDSVSVDDFTGQRLSVYTASQMEAYARAAIAALQHKVTPDTHEQPPAHPTCPEGRA